MQLLRGGEPGSGEADASWASVGSLCIIGFRVQGYDIGFRVQGHDTGFLVYSRV